MQLPYIAIANYFVGNNLESSLVQQGLFLGGGFPGSMNVSSPGPSHRRLLRQRQPEHWAGFVTLPCFSHVRYRGRSAISATLASTPQLTYYGRHPRS